MFRNLSCANWHSQESVFRLGKQNTIDIQSLFIIVDSCNSKVSTFWLLKLVFKLNLKWSDSLLAEISNIVRSLKMNWMAPFTLFLNTPKEIHVLVWFVVVKNKQTYKQKLRTFLKTCPLYMHSLLFPSRDTDNMQLTQVHWYPSVPSSMFCSY